MILKEEIQTIATEKGLGIDIVEKDYVLSWVLAGIHHHTLTNNSWIFKGGTCLRIRGQAWVTDLPKVS